MMVGGTAAVERAAFASGQCFVLSMGTRTTGFWTGGSGAGAVNSEGNIGGSVCFETEV